MTWRPRKHVALIAVAAAFGLAACADTPTAISEAALSPSFAANGQNKIGVCHQSGNGKYQLITVAQPAVAAHVAHGDGLPGGAYPGNAGVFGADCSQLITNVALDASTTYSTATHGGVNGLQAIDDCPAGSVGVGITGIGVDWFGLANMYGTSLHCRVLNSDGTLGASSYTPIRGGGGGAINHQPFAGDCASGQVLVNMSGTYTHGLITSYTGGCATISRVVASTGGQDSSIGPFSGSGFSNNIPYSEACAPGYVVTGIITEYGNVIDALGYRCTKVISV